MCLNCETDEELADCAFDADEHHPSDWPDDATREDYPDDLPEPQGWDDERGKPYDSNWSQYQPYQGSKTATEGRCNGLLTNWEDRYGERRYCMRLPEKKFGKDSGDSEFCYVHKRYETNDALMERASEVFTHGLYSKTIRHTYEHLSPWQKLTVLGWYDSYIQESDFDFDPTFESFSIDFSEFDDDLPLEIETMLDGEEQLSIDVPIPQEHENRGFALYRAALLDMKAGLAERVTLNTDDGTAVMEREKVVTVTDDGREITEEDEHHLNIPISRLDDSRDDLLAFGGVKTDDDASEVNVNVNDPSDLIVDMDETAAVSDDTNPVEDAMLDSASDDDEHSSSVSFTESESANDDDEDS